MRGIKMIVVGVDYSAFAGAALAQARRLSRETGAKVHAVHVVESHEMADLGEAIQKTLEQISGHFLRVAEEHVKREAAGAGIPPEDLTTQVEIGSPVAVLVRAVERVSADLLIVGRSGSTSHGKGMGGVAVQCVRAAPTRVLVLPSGAGEAFRRIVAATDFSENSRAALTEAVELAKMERAELHVVHVRRPEVGVPLGDPLLTPPVWLGDQGELDAAADRVARRKVEAELMPHAADLAGLTVLRVVHTHANAGLGLVEYAQSVRADLFVMGTMGRTGLKKLLLGSTAERVVRGGGIAVLAIKPAGFHRDVL